MRYRVTLEGFPVEEFAEGHQFADGDGAGHVVTSRETAWDAFKQLHPLARKVRAQHTPLLEAIEE